MEKKILLAGLVILFAAIIIAQISYPDWFSGRNITGNFIANFSGSGSGGSGSTSPAPLAETTAPSGGTIVSRYSTPSGSATAQNSASGLGSATAQNSASGASRPWEQTPNFCNDSDGGKNAIEAGYIRINGSDVPLSEDTCIDENIVAESFCRGDGSWGTINIPCTGRTRCKDGACLEPICDSPPTVRPRTNCILVTGEANENGTCDYKASDGTLCAQCESQNPKEECVLKSDAYGRCLQGACRPDRSCLNTSNRCRYRYGLLDDFGDCSFPVITENEGRECQGRNDAQIKVCHQGECIEGRENTERINYDEAIIRPKAFVEKCKFQEFGIKLFCTRVPV